MALEAVLWSQGECNADLGFRHNQSGYYSCAFPKMIDAWRSAFKAPDALFAFQVLPACTRTRNLPLLVNSGASLIGCLSSQM